VLPTVTPTPGDAPHPAHDGGVDLAIEQAGVPVVHPVELQRGLDPRAVQ
jgi:hypothetical protein